MPVIRCWYVRDCPCTLKPPPGAGDPVRHWFTPQPDFALAWTVTACQRKVARNAWCVSRPPTAMYIIVLDGGMAWKVENRLQQHFSAWKAARCGAGIWCSGAAGCGHGRGRPRRGGYEFPCPRFDAQAGRRLASFSFHDEVFATAGNLRWMRSGRGGSTVTARSFCCQEGES